MTKIIHVELKMNSSFFITAILEFWLVKYYVDFVCFFFTSMLKSSIQNNQWHNVFCLYTLVVTKVTFLISDVCPWCAWGPTLSPWISAGRFDTYTSIYIYIYGVQPCAYLTPCYDELRLGNKVKDHTASVTNNQKKRRK